MDKVTPADMDARRRQKKRDEVINVYSQGIDDVTELYNYFVERLTRESHLTAAVLALAAIIATPMEDTP